MTRMRFLAPLLALFALTATVHAEVPKQIGGIFLGGNVSAYQDRILPETTISLRNLISAKQADIIPPAGFASGMIWFGTCAGPSRVIRIKLKYADSSKRFFDSLLERYEQRFGEPQWKGDPFHMVSAWKWSFTSPDGRSIGMILQHNTHNQDETIGNSIKMTLWNLYEEEQKCFQLQTEHQNRKQKRFGRREQWNRNDWDQLLPH